MGLEEQTVLRTASPSGTAAQLQWRVAAVIVGIATLALLGLFWETASAMVRTWEGSATFNHGFLIFPISGYLIWRQRARLARLRPTPAPWGLILLAGLGLVWLLGRFANVLIVQEFALVAMIQALWLTVLGWRVGWALAFPLFYLYFAVPFGEGLVPPLQDFTAEFVTRALQMIGVPVFTNGIFISIPNGNFEVAEACAGVRFLIATLALGALFANIMYRSWWRRTAFLALAVIVPIVANGLRAFGIVLLAYLTNDLTAVSADHIIYGWVFFAIVTIILLLVGMTFQDGGPDEAPDESQDGGRAEHRNGEAPDRAPAASGGKASGGKTGAATAGLVAAGISAILVAAAPPAYGIYVDTQAPELARVTLAVPKVRAPWHVLAVPGNTWRPRFEGNDANLLASYADGERRVDLFIAYYRHQRQGAEVVNYAHALADGKIWVRAGGGNMRATVAGSAMNVAYTRMLSRQGGRLAWQWYWVDGVFTANPYVAKILEVKAKLLGGIQGAAIVAVAADYTTTPDEAVAVLRDFLGSGLGLRAALESAAKE